MKLKSLLLGLALAGAATANANDYFLGDITGNILSPAVITHTPGTFEDFFFFSLSAPSIGSGTTADIETWGPSGAFLNIVGATFATSLYQDFGTVGSADGADTGFVLGTGNYVSVNGPLAVGNYYIKIAGNAVGSLGGIYVAQANAMPVPEPESYAMMLAGLGLMGAIARRRMQK